MAELERQQLTVDDELMAYDASDELRAYLIEKLMASGKVKKAWLAQKVVRHYPESPALAIAVIDKGFHFSHESAAEKIIAQMDLNCAFYIVLKRSEQKKLAKKIIAINDQLI